MKKTPISVLCGIIAILVTVVSYFTIIGNIYARIICFVTLIGVVIAEIVVTCLAYYSKGEPRKVAATITVSFMIPISIILSVVYITKFQKNYGSYLGYYFSAFAVMLAISAILWKFADKKNTETDELQNAKTNILGMRKLVKCIMLKQNAEKYKKDLNEIDEKLHFTNDTVITGYDAEINKMLTELYENIDNEDFDVETLIKAIKNEIGRRDIFAKSTI